MAKEETTSTKSNRPPDDNFHQQKLTAWKPIITPLKVIALFTIIGVSFIPTGTFLMSSSNDIYEKVITYDGDGASPDCTITNQNQGLKCPISLTFDEDVDGPLYVYYQLENFYQNHRKYVSSLDSNQLGGEAVAKSTLDTTCIDLVTNGTDILNPCGLIANSFFTDIISLNSTSSTPSNLVLDENDISWSSDKDKYSQPNGFEYVEVSNSGVSCATKNLPSSCKYYKDPSTGKQYLYYYPDDDTTQYLYETYPEQISPILGVTDQHFKVWMRTAALPKFRKLYGKISGDFKKGNVLHFNIISNFEVDSFDGSKSLVISSKGEFGGKNPYLGVAYVVVGSISLFFAALFTLKQFFSPRPVADVSLLIWN